MILRQGRRKRKQQVRSISQEYGVQQGGIGCTLELPVFLSMTRLNAFSTPNGSSRSFTCNHVHICQVRTSGSRKPQAWKHLAMAAPHHVSRQSQQPGHRP